MVDRTRKLSTGGWRFPFTELPFFERLDFSNVSPGNATRIFGENKARMRLKLALSVNRVPPFSSPLHSVRSRLEPRDILMLGCLWFVSFSEGSPRNSWKCISRESSLTVQPLVVIWEMTRRNFRRVTSGIDYPNDCEREFVKPDGKVSSDVRFVCQIGNVIYHLYSLEFCWINHYVLFCSSPC